MDKELLKEKLANSKTEVIEAEERLVKLLRDTRGGPRAEKTTVTELVSEAITKLRIARADLEDLDKIVDEA